MQHSHERNVLLSALPPADWQTIEPAFKLVSLPLRRILSQEDQPIKSVHFPVSGVISTIAVLESGDTAEMSTTGREGFIPVSTIFGAGTAFARQMVQVPGAALTVDVAEFFRLTEACPRFKSLLHAYAEVYLASLMQTVACNGLHQIEQRAAKWLLLCHDRVGGDSLPITQEFLSEMLGVTRPSINAVLRSFSKAGLIKGLRGAITIERRQGLEAVACECYRVIRRRYETFLRPPRR